VHWLSVLGRLYVLRKVTIGFFGSFCPSVRLDRFMTLVTLLNEHPV